jgi:hypothetical protein
MTHSIFILLISGFIIWGLNQLGMGHSIFILLLDIFNDLDVYISNPNSVLLLSHLSGDFSHSFLSDPLTSQLIISASAELAL